jgi:hypothetical protein
MNSDSVEEKVLSAETELRAFFLLELSALISQHSALSPQHWGQI